jgi:oligosaccharide reducing-end xylanase
MKKVNVILLTVLFLTAVNVGYSRTIDPNYQVGTWRGFRTAAITYTFDDGCPNQYTIAIPMFNGYGYKLTMFTVTGMGWYEPTHWDQLQTAAAAGHEIASHTVTHPTLNTSNEVYELSNSKIAIEVNVPGSKCVTVAYPNCSESTESVIATYYIAGRNCDGIINPPTPSNFYKLGCHLLGNCCGNNTLASVTSKDDWAASVGGWCIFLIHGIDSDGGFSPFSSTTLDQSLQYLDARRNIFWVDTFGNVVRYIKERDDVSVSETSNTGDSITLAVTDTLDNAIYNYPVTLRRPLPAGWGSANVSQNGLPVTSSIVVVNSTAYVMFDVVPDGGDVVLSKGIYGDFTGDGVVDLNDLSFFVKFWPVNDCNTTIGVDVDEDCIVNFNEFAVLAENWRQAP